MGKTFLTSKLNDMITYDNIKKIATRQEDD